MALVLLGWILYTLHAPHWVWAVFFVFCATELRAIPLYLWLVRQYRARDKGE